MPVHFWSLPCMADIYVQFLSLLFTSCLTYSGDYSIRVPPLPIPNREVKPDHADGTASSGRVGSCRFSGKPPYRKIWGLFVFTLYCSIQFSSSWRKSTCRKRWQVNNILPINNKNKEPFSHLLPYLLCTDGKNI